jgi:hypothetical protein
LDLGWVYVFLVKELDFRGNDFLDVYQSHYGKTLSFAAQYWRVASWFEAKGA